MTWFARCQSYAPFWKCHIHIEKVSFSNYFNSFQVIFMIFSWFSFDNVEIVDIHISDTSIFNRYIIIVNIYSNFNNLHITCTSSRLYWFLFAKDNNNSIVSQETNIFLLNSVWHSSFTHFGSNFYSQLSHGLVIQRR